MHALATTRSWVPQLPLLHNFHRWLAPSAVLLSAILAACGGGATQPTSQDAGLTESNGGETTTAPQAGRVADRAASQTARTTGGAAKASGAATTPSEGCGRLPGQRGGPMRHRLQVAASEDPAETNQLTREYYLYVPESYRPERPYSLVFSFHSCGGNGENRFPIEALQLSGDSTIVVSPTGLSPSPGCHGNGWAAPSDLPLFDALYEAITTNYCVDLNRVFSTGHSYGGEMTNLLNCRRGELLAATASRSGGLAGDANCGPEFPATFLAHVEGDTSPAPFSASEALLKVRLADRGCDGEDAFDINGQGCREYRGCSTAVTYCRCTEPIAECELTEGHSDSPHGVTHNRPYRYAAWNFLQESQPR